GTPRRRLDSPTRSRRAASGRTTGPRDLIERRRRTQIGRRERRSRSAERRDVLAEARERLLAALDRAVHADDALELLGAREDAVHRDLRLLSLRLEGPRGPEAHALLAGPAAAVLEDDPLGALHLDEDALVGVVGAVGAVHRVAPDAAGA